MDRKKATCRSDSESEWQAKELFADVKGWYDVESRLDEWERFFRSVMRPFLDSASPHPAPYGALKSDAPRIAHVARDALVMLTQTRQAIATGNVRGVAVTLLDIAHAAASLFFLDSEQDAAIRDKANETLRLGRESRTPKAQRIAAMIRDEVKAIQDGSPFRMTSTSARQALSRKLAFKDGTPMVSLRTINAAYAKRR